MSLITSIHDFLPCLFVVDHAEAERKSMNTSNGPEKMTGVVFFAGWLEPDSKISTMQNLIFNLSSSAEQLRENLTSLVRGC